MMAALHRIRITHGLACALMWVALLSGTPALAQTAASIVGQVVDESGATLPGVTVTATSPALQVPSVTAVTDERGEYRLTPLPIGVFAVTYELAGFQTVKREGLRLTSGFTARVDLSLKVGGLQESVTVSGASPVVDVASTATSTRLTAEVLETTPTGRVGFFALLQQAPGVRNAIDIGGSSANANSITFRSFGQSGEAWQMLEGILTASAKTGQSGNYFDYASVEEARVQTVGADASMPLRGVMMDVTVKSGSNQFKGTTWWQQTNSSFQSSNLDDALRSQGITDPAEIRARWTVNSDLGGRVVRDKLWFYIGGTRNVNNETVLGAYKPDGTPAEDNKNLGLVQHEDQLPGVDESQVRRLPAVSKEGCYPKRHAVRALGVTDVSGAERDHRQGRVAGGVEFLARHQCHLRYLAVELALLVSRHHGARHA